MIFIVPFRAQFTTGPVCYLIYVKTLTGTRISIEVNLEMTVEELKGLICDMDGIPPDQQRLIFAARRMNDGDTLAHIRLTEGSTAHLVQRLRGGMFHFTSGREELSPFLPDAARTVWDVFTYQCVLSGSGQNPSIADLQKSIIEGRTLLSDLNQSSEDLY